MSNNLFVVLSGTYGKTITGRYMCLLNDNCRIYEENKPLEKGKIYLCKLSEVKEDMNVILQCITSFTDEFLENSSKFLENSSELSNKFYKNKQVICITAAQPIKIFNKLYDFFSDKLFVSGRNYELKTGIDLYYSYSNLFLALSACKLLEDLNYTNYRKCNLSNGIKLYQCPHFTKNFTIKNENLIFPEYYKKYSIDNIDIIVEPGLNQNVINLLSHKLDEMSGVKIAVIDVNNLNTLIPLSNVFLSQIFIVNYDEEKSQKIFEFLTDLYNNSKNKQTRLQSFGRIKEYSYLDLECKKDLPGLPILTIDNVNYIHKWMSKLSKTNLKVKYNVACFGSKRLIYDIFEKIF
jgi:hypothetical protein